MMHSWSLSAKEAIEIQRLRAGQILLKPKTSCIHTIAGADISYNSKSNILYAAAIVLDIQTFEIIEKQTASGISDFPYIPGLLSFRELPILLDCFRNLVNSPDVIICDGQGHAHPRRFGLACHLGLLLNIPTIGCAKSKLIGKGDMPGYKRGSISDLTDKGEKIGGIVRTRDRVKPVYVSPGHLMDIEKSIEVVLQCCTKYRLPEPTRQAHLEVNRFRIENNEN
jgi:deoxyribonuclease V